jgi:hypothetical protein
MKWTNVISLESAFQELSNDIKYAILTTTAYTKVAEVKVKKLILKYS